MSVSVVGIFVEYDHRCFPFSAITDSEKPSERLKASMFPLEGGQYVKLNVGGCLFQTTVSTLTKHDTMLRAMFSGRMELITDNDGWVLIDRSGRHFGLILDHLRNGSAPLPERKWEVEEVMQEAKYYIIQDLISECQSWLDVRGAREDPQDPLMACTIPIVHTKQQVDKYICTAIKPVIKLLLNRHNNKYSYTIQSDDNIMKNLELFDRLAVKFHDRILFLKDIGSDSSEVCQWKFYGKGALRAEVCCTSIVYATDKKQTKVDFPDSKIYDESMSILRYEERGVCARCGDICMPGGPSPSNTPTPLD